MKRKILCLTLVMLLVLPAITPAFAWKLETHAYSANLILDELARNNGKLEVYPYGKFKVPDEIRNAVERYPEAFRAGSLGPDVYPGIFTGQGMIHPDTGGSYSGDWLNLMVDEYQSMPSSDAKVEALAFILGYSVHYAGDLFGHSYVNEWTGGPFPAMSEVIKSESATDNVQRHLVVEGYIDSKVPSNYTTDSKIQVTAPISFVKKTLLEQGAEKYQVIDFMEPILELRNNLDEVSYKNKAFTGDLSVSSLLKYGVNTAITSYSDRWRDDIDKGLYEYIKANQEFGALSLNRDKSSSDTIRPLTDWASDYAPMMSPVPDVAFQYIGIKKDIVFEISKAVGLPEIEEEWNKIKHKAFLAAAKEVFGADLADMVTSLKDPTTYMNASLFPDTGAQTQSMIDEDLGNFSNISNLDQVDFEPMYNTLQMGKLILVGSDNLNKIFGSNMFEKPQMIAAFDRLNIHIRTKSNSMNIFSDSGTNGTDDDIFFHLVLRDGTKYTKLMDKATINDFEGGNDRVYHMDLPKRVTYGEIAQVIVEKKNIVNDDWGPDFIEVYPDNGKMVLPKTSFNKYFRGNTSWTQNISLPEEVNGHSSFDPTIINFIHSLDDSQQWAFSKIYKKSKDAFHEVFTNIEDVDFSSMFSDKYENTFDGNSFNDFDLYGGEWYMAGGYAQLKTTKNVGGKAILKGRAYQNFEMSTTLSSGDLMKRGTPSYYDAGLIFRVSRPGMGPDDLNGYYFGLSAGKDNIVVGKFEDNKWHRIETIPYNVYSYEEFAVNNSLRDQLDYTLKVRAIGDKMSLYVNNEKVYTLRDDSFEEGFVGLRMYANEKDCWAGYSDLKIVPLDENGETPKAAAPKFDSVKETIPGRYDSNKGMDFQDFTGGVSKNDTGNYVVRLIPDTDEFITFSKDFYLRDGFVKIAFWGDKFTQKIPDEAATLGMLFRASVEDGKLSGYLLAKETKGKGRGDVVCYKYTEGKAKRIFREKDIGAENWDHAPLEVRADGGNFTVTLNGSPLGTFEDDEAYTAGLVGIYTTVKDELNTFEVKSLYGNDSTNTGSSTNTPSTTPATTPSTTATPATTTTSQQGKSGGVEFLNTEGIKFDNITFAVSFDYNGECYYTTKSIDDLTQEITSKIVLNDKGEDNGTCIIGNYLVSSEQNAPVPSWQFHNYTGDISNANGVLVLTINGQTHRIYKQWANLDTDHMYKIVIKEGTPELVETY